MRLSRDKRRRLKYQGERKDSGRISRCWKKFIIRKFDLVEKNIFEVYMRLDLDKYK